MLSSQSIRRPAVLVFVAVAVLLCLIKLSFSLDRQPWRSAPTIGLQQEHYGNSNSHGQQGQQGQVETLVKPKNYNITGMVFFGRRDRAASMNCYVERNLVDNGGWLDEVLWFANTNNKEDLKFLDEIIARSPRYKKIPIKKPVGWPDYTKLWRGVQRGTIYVKLDDDIVWLADDAIPHMVTTKIKYPDSFAVSANVINGPPLSFLHFHLGALHPYFPELEADPTYTNHSSSENWRPSSHPFWSGPSTFRWPQDRDPPEGGKHRWLRVNDDRALHRTPVANLTYDFWGPTYESWAIAAQQHYSLLENLERNTTDLYKFQPPWNMQGERIRINCLAILGDDILDTDVEHWPNNRGDEDMIVLDLPKKLQRHVLIEGKALAAHFNFMHQHKITATDLLSRYNLYANEFICRHGSQSKHQNDGPKQQ
ncbi:conserved hypothetical protein [Histoplasma capsulatum G186AR]|uniref:Uncharacterized protein n=2 Tax=Ajellomyces capsulatus TaxID=5037 RepID=C0NZA9_AJECG|nr:uncharacterized protein HCBG_08489 [Histoplasma capsulatum G186AR]EEH03157.1 conserved hypothetical protein [Histoplasma capsulatum G186AR]KAG5290440.1 hypothetical protein I7I52_07458 [Histoplasma capsulatum]QSS72368.1 hypothetical protein I7I50_00189 [Histoplasma capsulatum G186AR]